MRVISAKKRERPSCSESWIRSVAPTASALMRSDAARTGAPACASTALMPTVRSSVLLPDMFEPLTTRSWTLRRQADVVGLHARRGHQRVAEPGALEARAGLRVAGERGERVGGMLERVRRQRRQRLELADDAQPHADVRAVPPPPPLERPRQVDAPHQQERDRARRPCCAASRASPGCGAGARSPSTPAARFRGAAAAAAPARPDEKWPRSSSATACEQRGEIARRGRRRRGASGSTLRQYGQPNASCAASAKKSATSLPPRHTYDRRGHGEPGEASATQRNAAGDRRGRRLGPRRQRARIHAGRRTADGQRQLLARVERRRSAPAPPPAAPRRRRAAPRRSATPASVSSPVRVRASDSSSKSEPGPNRSRSLA